MNIVHSYQKKKRKWTKKNIEKISNKAKVNQTHRAKNKKKNTILNGKPINRQFNNRMYRVI